MQNWETALFVNKYYPLTKKRRYKYSRSYTISFLKIMMIIY
ncbi:unnamed protein product [Arabidopsis halleri]